MPSNFESEFAESAAPDLMEEFGRDAEYVPPAGDSITGGKVRIRNERSQDVTTDDKSRKAVVVRQCELTCLPSFVAVPVINGRFVVGSDRWTVASRPVFQNGQWDMDCECIQEHRLNEMKAARN